MWWRCKERSREVAVQREEGCGGVAKRREVWWRYKVKRGVVALCKEKRGVVAVQREE